MDGREQCIVDHGDERWKWNWEWHCGLHRGGKHGSHHAHRHADDRQPDGDGHPGGHVQFQRRPNCTKRDCGWRFADSGSDNDERMHMDRREQQHGMDHRDGRQQRNRQWHCYLQCRGAHLDDPADRDADDCRADTDSDAEWRMQFCSWINRADGARGRWTVDNLRDYRHRVHLGNGE
jgi:hypothetical protein